MDGRHNLPRTIARSCSYAAPAPRKYFPSKSDSPATGNLPIAGDIAKHAACCGHHVGAAGPHPRAAFGGPVSDATRPQKNARHSPHRAILKSFLEPAQASAPGWHLSTENPVLSACFRARRLPSARVWALRDSTVDSRRERLPGRCLTTSTLVYSLLSKRYGK